MSEAATQDAANATTTSYPRGGLTNTNGGQGIFIDITTGEGLEIWVDTDLKDRQSLLHTLEKEGARIAVNHRSSTVSLLLLSPRSVPIFDSYCHPSWYTPAMRARYEQRSSSSNDGEDVEEWTRKVMLKGWWVRDCILKGKFLGEAEDWGGCRAGGPRARSESSDLVIGTRRQLGKTETSTPALPKDTAPPGLRTPSASLEPVPLVQSQAVQFMPLTPTTDRQASVSLNRDKTVPPFIPPTPASEAADASSMITDKAIDTEMAPPPSPRQLTPSDIDLPTTASEVQEEIEDEKMLEPVTPSAARDVLAVRRSIVDDISMEENDSDEGDISASKVDHGRMAEEEWIGRLEGEQLPGGFDNGWLIRSDAGPSRDPSSSAQLAATSNDTGESSSRALRPGTSDHVPLPIPRVGSAKKTGKFFAGLRLWVDLSRPGRKQLMKQFLNAGAQICADYNAATHILVHDYRYEKWDNIVAGVVKLGVWVMDFEWAIQSLVAERKLPELGQHVPGGAPVLLGEEDTNVQRLSNDEIADVLKSEGRYAYKGKEKVNSLAERLAHKYTLYDVAFWRGSYYQWRDSTGRFKDRPLPHIGEGQLDIPVERLAKIFKIMSKRQEKEGFKLEKAIKILRIENGTYSAEAWGDLYREWDFRIERFAGLSPPKKAPAEIPPVSKKTFTGREGTKRLQAIFETVDEEIKGKQRTLEEVSMRFQWEYEVFSTEQWRSLYSDWQARRNRFAGTRSHTPEPTPIRHKRELAKDVTALFEEMPASLSDEEVGERLAAKNGVHSPRTWAMYRAIWREEDDESDEKGRTSYSGRELGTSASAPQVNSQASSSSVPVGGEARMSTAMLTGIFEEHQQLVESGMTINDLIARLVEKFGTYTTGTWKNHYGDWRRGIGRFAPSPQPPIEERKMSKAELAAIFEEHEPMVQGGMRIAALIATLAEEYGTYTTGTWREYYNEWKGRSGTRGEASGPDMPAKLQPSTSTPPLKRPAEDKRHDETPRKKFAGVYTEEEDREMAAYIHARLPETTALIKSDWTDFAEAHPARSLTAYIERYRKIAFKIDRYVAELSHESDDESVVALDTPPRSFIKAEVIVVED